MSNEQLTVASDERKGWTSASNAHADGICHGRHLAQAGLTPVDSEDSEFGDEIHDALAKQDPAKLDQQQTVIYEDMNEITDKAMDMVFGADAKRAKVIREHRMWVKVRNGDKTYMHSGKVDFIATFERRGLIVDYKSLPGEVADSPKNHQLRDQAVLGAGFMLLDNVTVMVNQPLVTRNPELCVYTKQDIKTAEQEMFARVIASNNPEAKRTAHTVACKFCLARFNCPEFSKWMDSMLPDTINPFARPVENWTEEQKIYFLNVRGTLKKWIEHCEDKLKLEMEKTKITGWKLKPGRNRSVINNPQELFRRFVEIGRPWAKKNNTEMHEDYVLQPLFMDAVVVNKERFANAVSQVTGLKGKKLESALELMLSNITTDTKDKESIAPEV